MKRLDSTMLKVFLYGLPLVIGSIVFVQSYGWEFSARMGGYIQAVYNFGGLVLVLWTLLSVYLLVRLMVCGAFREKVLNRLTFIKERDEREAMLTGRAAKTTMLTSLAILIVLFFLSCIQVSVSSLPPEKAIDGKTKVFSLGWGFSLLDNSRQAKLEEDLAGKTIVSYTGLPVSSSTVIVGLIVWQIVSYNYSMKRLMK